MAAFSPQVKTNGGCQVMFSTRSGAAKLSLVVIVTLVVVKVIVAVITGSLSISAQAMDSFLDLFSVLIMVFAIRVAVMPADAEHPFGHGKVEGIAAGVQAVLIIGAGGYVIYSAVRRITEGTTIALAEAGMRHLIDRKTGAILRLTKVMMPGTPVVQSWRRDLAAGRRIGPFSNLPLATISVEFALQTIEVVLSERLSAIFHASSQEDSSYLSLAHVVAEHEGADPGLIRPVEAVAGSIGFDFLPRFSSLDMQLEARDFDLQAPSAKDVFRGVLAS